MRTLSRRTQALAFAITVLAGSAFAVAQAHAQVFTSSFKGTSGQTEQASAVFSLLNGTLTLVLSNTSTFTTYSNPDVLSGVFFAIAGNPVLTPISATASAHTTCGACVSGDVGVKYAYVYSTSGFKTSGGAAFTSDAYGVGAPGYSGLSPNFGHGEPSFKPGTNHATGQGLSYSIVGPDYVSGGNGTFVQNSVTFQWSLPGVTTVAISNVLFTYGTAPDASNPAKAPEPATAGLFAVGALASGLLRYRRARTVGSPGLSA